MERLSSLAEREEGRRRKGRVARDPPRRHRHRPLLLILILKLVVATLDLFFGRAGSCASRRVRASPKPRRTTRGLCSTRMRWCRNRRRRACGHCHPAVIHDPPAPWTRRRALWFEIAAGSTRFGRCSSTRIRRRCQSVLVGQSAILIRVYGRVGEGVWRWSSSSRVRECSRTRIDAPSSVGTNQIRWAREH